MGEMKRDPNWVPKKGQVNVPVKVTLIEGKPKATGQSQYGEWNLWLIEVENGTVVDKETKVETAGYTGKATWFPSKKAQEDIMKITNGTKEGVKIEVTKTFEENEKGVYTTYKIVVVGEGSTPTQTLNPTQLTYLTNFEKFTKMNILNDTKEDFMEFGRQDPYKLTNEILEKLWIVKQEK